MTQNALQEKYEHPYPLLHIDYEGTSSLLAESLALSPQLIFAIEEDTVQI
eukprot:CAMPEP_0182434344 /NCGR_PEP_ID=MMETSP1167-20130531/69327_1 /TAXON_ID=2988 /ORGANISM="Mallomonas Sp, Strain CCMP3275" /LENGTH=49 /DNA_ID=CAMNT_0024624133 /DNA_START=463 /DNA_END=612 /DNA_ORIENTATION=-